MDVSVYRYRSIHNNVIGVNKQNMSHRTPAMGSLKISPGWSGEWSDIYLSISYLFPLTSELHFCRPWVWDKVTTIVSWVTGKREGMKAQTILISQAEAAGTGARAFPGLYVRWCGTYDRLQRIRFYLRILKLPLVCSQRAFFLVS